MYGIPTPLNLIVVSRGLCHQSCKKKKRKQNKINPMFNFWFSEFVIPIVVTCPPSPQTTDIDDTKLGQTFCKRNDPRKLQQKLKPLDCLPPLSCSLYSNVCPSASPDPSIGCTDLSGNTKRKEKKHWNQFWSWNSWEQWREAKYIGILVTFHYCILVESSLEGTPLASCQPLFPIGRQLDQLWNLWGRRERTVCQAKIGRGCEKFIHHLPITRVNCRGRRYWGPGIVAWAL